MTARQLGLVVVLLGLACRAEKSIPAPKPVAEAQPKPASAEPRSCVDTAPAWRFAAPGRIVSIGDVHGDRDALEALLRAAAVIGDDRAWIAGNTTVVQTGDILDRGDDEREILELLAALAEQAERVGGRIVQLNGNHELMNASGDFRYVTPGGWQDFAPPGAHSAPAIRSGRAQAFAPGGEWARRLAGFPVIAMVGDSLFAHGGVLRAHVEGGIEPLNTAVHCWLLGEGPPPAPVLASDDSPVWTRRYGDANPPCTELAAVLENTGSARLVVGHTVQPAGISSACDETLWRIDVGLAAAYGGRPAALEILPDGTARPLVPGDQGSSSP